MCFSLPSGILPLSAASSSATALEDRLLLYVTYIMIIIVVHETEHGQIIFFVYSRQREAAFAMSASVVVQIINSSKYPLHLTHERQLTQDDPKPT